MSMGVPILLRGGGCFGTLRTLAFSTGASGPYSLRSTWVGYTIDFKRRVIGSRVAKGGIPHARPDRNTPTQISADFGCRYRALRWTSSRHQRTLDPTNRSGPT